MLFYRNIVPYYILSTQIDKTLGKNEGKSGKKSICSMDFIIIWTTTNPSNITLFIVSYIITLWYIILTLPDQQPTGQIDE